MPWDIANRSAAVMDVLWDRSDMETPRRSLITRALLSHAGDSGLLDHL
jgi:hypothetical protein